MSPTEKIGFLRIDTTLPGGDLIFTLRTSLQRRAAREERAKAINNTRHRKVSTTQHTSPNKSPDHHHAFKAHHPGIHATAQTPRNPTISLPLSPPHTNPRNLQPHYLPHTPRLCLPHSDRLFSFFFRF